MDIFEAITSRRSIRIFLKRPVPDEILRKCLEAARWAPSGGNTQPWRFIVVRNKEKINRFDPYQNQPWVESAPVVVVCCVDPSTKWTTYDESINNLFIGFLDLGAAIQNFLLTVHAAGLGAVWVASFSPRKVRELCAIPPHLFVVSLICMGYYDESAALGFRERTISNKDHRTRKPVMEFCFYETFGNTMFDEDPCSG
ncbi:nitroreductase family protein [candidate division CSSED10-310 bacterium]|uniref:Nitroreductase family protein n=1 Tax=candidate division CSSED10-310 bacterium TaxID=2855610 RepID=A0ABV6YWF5_UNCC1